MKRKLVTPFVLLGLTLVVASSLTIALPSSDTVCVGTPLTADEMSFAVGSCRQGNNGVATYYCFVAASPPNCQPKFACCDTSLPQSGGYGCNNEPGYKLGDQAGTDTLTASDCQYSQNFSQCHCGPFGLSCSYESLPQENCGKLGKYGLVPTC